jgi:hypothetical protein
MEGLIACKASERIRLRNGTQDGKRIRSDALQAFLNVRTFAYSFFYLIMQYELQCSKFPQ